MDSNEILLAVESQGIANFLGVFAADELHDIGKDQLGVFIVNTDPSHLSGQHWISIYLDESDIYFYDPLSLDKYKSKYFNVFLLRMNKVLHVNILKVQDVNSVMCGYHALVFCYVMSTGGSEHRFKSFLKSFKPYNVINREQLSLTYYSLIWKK